MADHILTEAGDFIDTEISDRLITETVAAGPFSAVQTEDHTDPNSLQVITRASVSRGSTR